MHLEVVIILQNIMSGARIINEDSFQKLLTILEFANQMKNFAKDQLDKYEKDPRMDIDSLDRIKLYFSVSKIYEQSETTVNHFIQKNMETSTDYLESSDDDDIKDFDDIQNNNAILKEAEKLVQINIPNFNPRRNYNSDELDKLHQLTGDGYIKIKDCYNKIDELRDYYSHIYNIITIMLEPKYIKSSIKTDLRSEYRNDDKTLKEVTDLVKVDIINFDSNRDYDKDELNKMKAVLTDDFNKFRKCLHDLDALKTHYNRILSQITIMQTKNNYMQDYVEADDDDDYDGQRQFALDYDEEEDDRDNDIRGNCGQRALNNDMNAFRDMAIDDFDLPNEDENNIKHLLNLNEIPVDEEDHSNIKSVLSPINNSDNNQMNNDGKCKENLVNTDVIGPLKLVIPEKYLPIKQTEITTKYNRKNWKPVQNSN
jgi:hypothetical protein